MLHPLVSLWRPTCRVTFYDTGAGASFGNDWMDDALPPLAMKRGFRSADEAISYLRFWLSDPAASTELRWLLKKCAPAPIAGAPTPERWLHSLATLVLQGVVMVVEESARQARPGRLVAAPSAGAAAAAAALSSLPSLASVPAVAVAVPLLPLVEDVRIESAEVLPELEQTLEQVNATIAQVEAASANVEPAPNKVADITTAMNDAAERAQQAIDDA